MQPVRTSPLLATLVLAATLSTFTTAHATAVRQTAGTPSSWMPDVAERVASLRERTERAAAEANVRSRDDARSGRWWRSLAVRPQTDHAR